jgi:hypothetical protein
MTETAMGTSLALHFLEETIEVGYFQGTTLQNNRCKRVNSARAVVVD